MAHIEELWVPIDGYPNYEVSNYGEICNVNTGRILKYSEDKHGYHRVVLYNDGVRAYFSVHRVVAQAFFLNYREDGEVEHVNPEHRHDNSVMNITLGKKNCRTAKR